MATGGVSGRDVARGPNEFTTTGSHAAESTARLLFEMPDPPPRGLAEFGAEDCVEVVTTHKRGFPLNLEEMLCADVLVGLGEGMHTTKLSDTIAGCGVDRC